jgi:hypothetical protein
LESLLATTLQGGTWIAGAVIAAGLGLPLLDGSAVRVAAGSSDQVVDIGIALLILLPVVRVVLMLIVFVRDRDYLFGAIAGFVLLVITIGLVLGAQ